MSGAGDCICYPGYADDDAPVSPDYSVIGRPHVVRNRLDEPELDDDTLDDIAEGRAQLRADRRDRYDFD